MTMHIADSLRQCMREHGIAEDGIQLPEAALDADAVRVIMINEVPPPDPADSFYSRAENPAYMTTVLPLFRDAGFPVGTVDDITGMGIYLTTAVKSPKQGYAVPTEMIDAHLPLLEHELGLFPNLRVIMLMGDVAKKAVNKIARRHTKMSAVPSGSTYKIRSGEFFYGDLRVFPSYIMTGGNILIEKSKCVMIADDIKRMMAYIAD